MEKGPVFGLNIGELLTIYDRDSRSWKMSECLFTGDYAKYSEAFPKSGIMLNGRIYEQATWVPRTGGKESGLWPTPDQRGFTNDGSCEMLMQKCESREEWSGMTYRKGNGAKAVMWPTPHSNCHTGAGKRGEGGENLQTAVKWPTPQQRDWKGKSQRGADPENRDCLPNAVMNFPTPRANKVEGYSSEGFRPTLAHIVTGEDKPLHGQLNAEFVEWLMNYPKGWTETD